MERLRVSDDGMTAKYGVTANFQGEDRNKEGEGTWYVQFLPGFSLFLRVSLWFPGVSSGLPSFLSCFMIFLFSVPFCSAILVFGMLMYDHSS